MPLDVTRRRGRSKVRRNFSRGVYLRDKLLGFCHLFKEKFVKEIRSIWNKLAWTLFCNSTTHFYTGFVLIV